ncbi:MAG: superinfection immunity protein [Vulcanimicrobiaceae bacterium]
MAALYFAPTLVAMSRKHSSTVAILVLNLLLGWTALGWIVALVWALNVDRKVVDVNVTNAPPPRPVERYYPPIEAAPAAALPDERECPHCLSRIPTRATACRFCQRDVPPQDRLDA